MISRIISLSTGGCLCLWRNCSGWPLNFRLRYLTTRNQRHHSGAEHFDILNRLGVTHKSRIERETDRHSDSKCSALRSDKWRAVRRSRNIVDWLAYISNSIFAYWLVFLGGPGGRCFWMKEWMNVIKVTLSQELLQGHCTETKWKGKIKRGTVGIAAHFARSPNNCANFVTSLSCACDIRFSVISRL